MKRASDLPGRGSGAWAMCLGGLLLAATSAAPARGQDGGQDGGQDAGQVPNPDAGQNPDPPDAGPDEPPPLVCGDDLTQQGACFGQTAAWCSEPNDDGEGATALAETLDCAARGGSCLVIANFGAWCTVPTGNECALPGNEGITQLACGAGGAGPGPGCSITEGCSDDAPACVANQAPTCSSSGELVLRCSVAGQALYVDCAGPCVDGACTEQAEGATCDDDQLRCAAPLVCFKDPLDPYGICRAEDPDPAPDAGSSMLPPADVGDSCRCTGGLGKSRPSRGVALLALVLFGALLGRTRRARRPRPRRRSPRRRTRGLLIVSAGLVAASAPGWAQDAGVDGGPGDAGGADAGAVGPAPDAGPGDAGPVDPGSPDAGGPDSGSLDAGPDLSCDPDVFETMCTDTTLTLCSAQTETLVEVDCPTRYDDLDDDDDLRGLEANTICGAPGCVETGTDADCTRTEVNSCVGGPDGLCQLVTFGDTETLPVSTYCDEGLSCAVTVELLPPHVPVEQRRSEFVNRCFPSFGTCAPEQRGGPCVEMLTPGDTMSYCHDPRPLDQSNQGVVRDVNGFRCDVFAGGGACVETEDGRSTCAFPDNFCANVVDGIYGCDHDQDGTVSGACDFGVALPEPWGVADQPDRGTCIDHDATCTPTDVQEDFQPVCRGDFLVTQCNHYVDQGMGWDCGRVPGARCDEEVAACVVPAGGPCFGSLNFLCAEGLLCDMTNRCIDPNGTPPADAGDPDPVDAGTDPGDPACGCALAGSGPGAGTMRAEGLAGLLALCSVWAVGRRTRRPVQPERPS